MVCRHNRVVSKLVEVKFITTNTKVESQSRQRGGHSHQSQPVSVMFTNGVTIPPHSPPFPISAFCVHSSAVAAV